MCLAKHMFASRHMAYVPRQNVIILFLMPVLEESSLYTAVSIPIDMILGTKTDHFFLGNPALQSVFLLSRHIPSGFLNAGCEAFLSPKTHAVYPTIPSLPIPSSCCQERQASFYQAFQAVLETQSLPVNEGLRLMNQLQHRRGCWLVVALEFLSLHSYLALQPLL